MNPSELQLPPTHRPAFFAGEVLHAAELADVVAVERSLRWLHNRTLHGWGIGLGLEVAGARAATAVSVEIGYALDAGGRDLVLEEAVTLPVPPVASGADGGPADYLLVLAYTEDEAAVVELRDGACETAGAVRRHDDPTVAWRVPQAVREGLDIVLAAAKVAGCALAAPLVTDAVRRSLGSIPSPRVVTGRSSSPWVWWPSDAVPAGVKTTVDTSTGDFRQTPVYEASIAGSFENQIGGKSYLIAGAAHVEHARPRSFELVVPLPEGRVDAGTLGVFAVNPRDKGSLLDLVNTWLGWSVQWIGVETA
jgi:hypothetical protein